MIQFGGFLAALLSNFVQPLRPLVTDPSALITDYYSWQRSFDGPNTVIWNRLDGFEPDLSSNVSVAPVGGAGAASVGTQ